MVGLWRQVTRGVFDKLLPHAGRLRLPEAFMGWERSLAVLQGQRRPTIKMIGEGAIQKLSLINDVIERRSLKDSIPIQNMRFVA